MEERRLLLAFALSLLVLTAYRLLVTPPVPQAPPTSAPSSAPVATTNPAAPPPVAVAPTPAPARAIVQSKGDSKERRIEVQTPAGEVVLTNRGARIFSWRLKAYKDAEGAPVEMVEAIPGGARPLDLDTGDATLDEHIRGALFEVSAETLEVPPKGEGTLIFQYGEANLEVRKTLHFRAPGYLVGVRVDLSLDGRPKPVRVLWGPGVGRATQAETEVRGYQPPQGVVLSASGVDRIAPNRLGSGRNIPDARWGGVESTYWAALWVPRVPGGLDLKSVNLPPGEDGKPRPSPVSLALLTPETPETVLFVGPKDYRLLEGLGYDLAKVVPVGEWLGPLVIPLMSLLRWIYTHIGNYGWSIVALTLLINLVMSPLRHYSFANGQKMAKIAPEMRVIQERYKGIPALDKRREQMQREISDLYARHGMSMGTQMAVGCLPMLLTLPFLFAIYRVLQISIELRGAPFLWISDLSQKDPLFVTPIVMGISMFIMQKMTPTAMDPAQQRMMMIMPLVLVGGFLWAPAGLNLYWLSSNVCSLVQQGITQRILKQEEKRPKRKEGRKE